MTSAKDASDYYADWNNPALSLRDRAEAAVEQIALAAALRNGGPVIHRGERQWNANREAADFAIGALRELERRAR